MSAKLFEEDGRFRTVASDGGDELRQHAVRGAGVTLLSGGIGLGIQIISAIVLARLLTPTDFGVMTMVTTFSLLIVSLGQNGFPEAVVQRKQMSRALASNLFWINLGCGAVLTIGFAAAGSLMASLYHDRRVANVALGVALTIFFTSTSVLHIALLKRAMRFTAVSVNDIVSRAVYLAVAIVLGWAGWGYWALVAAAVALPLSQSIGAWFLCGWVPDPPRRHVAGTKSTLLFATNTYGRFAVNYGTRNTDNLLIGLRFSAQALGFYKKAYDLFSLSATQFVNSLDLVFLSALRRVDRKSPEFHRYILGAITVMAFGGMGLAADLTLIGKDLIRILLGPRWEQTGRIFVFFGPGIGAMIVYHTHSWIHLSIGRADRWLRWGIIEFIITVSLFLAALPWGPEGIAVAWAASFWVLAIPAMWYAGKPIGFGVGPVLAALWRYIVASLLAGSATSLIIQRIPSLWGAPGAAGAAARVAASTLLLGFSYLTAVIVLHWSPRPIYQIAELLLQMAPWRTLQPPVLAASGFKDTSVTRTTDQRQTAAPLTSRKPLVSILIPAYNAEQWIAEAIESALAQTWQPKEIIVVDDGSGDRTLEVARQFESDLVRVVSQPHRGASAARNTALTLCHGDYIQWLDADDVLAADKVARQMGAADECGDRRTLFSAPWGQFLYRPDNAKFIPSALWCDLSPVEFLLRKMGQNLFMQTSTWLVSRELTEAAGPWSTTLSVDDDGEYFCRILMASHGIRFVPDAKVHYRYSGTAGLAYVGDSPSKMESKWHSMQLHMTYLESLENSERVRNTCLKFLQLNLIDFYPERMDIVEQMHEKAATLGGRLETPHLSWKFSWVRLLCGWGFAKRAQLFLPHLKLRLLRSLHKIYFSRQTEEERPMIAENHANWQGPPSLAVVQGSSPGTASETSGHDHELA